MRGFRLRLSVTRADCCAKCETVGYWSNVFAVFPAKLFGALLWVDRQAKKALLVRSDFK